MGTVGYNLINVASSILLLRLGAKCGREDAWTAGMLRVRTRKSDTTSELDGVGLTSEPPIPLLHHLIYTIAHLF